MAFGMKTQSAVRRPFDSTSFPFVAVGSLHVISLAMESGIPPWGGKTAWRKISAGRRCEFSALSQKITKFSLLAAHRGALCRLTCFRRFEPRGGLARVIFRPA